MRSIGISCCSFCSILNFSELPLWDRGCARGCGSQNEWNRYVNLYHFMKYNLKLTRGRCAQCVYLLRAKRWVPIRNHVRQRILIELISGFKVGFISLASIALCNGTTCLKLWACRIIHHIWGLLRLDLYMNRVQLARECHHHWQGQWNGAFGLEPNVCHLRLSPNYFPQNGIEVAWSHFTHMLLNHFQLSYGWRAPIQSIHSTRKVTIGNGRQLCTTFSE